MSMRMPGADLDHMVKALARRIDRRSAASVALLALVKDRDSARAGTCRGLKARCKRSSQCCSGLCKGKNKMTCRAHDTGGCQPGEGTCATAVHCTTSEGLDGLCYTTSGNAGFCGHTGFCRDCDRDSDCQAEFGPRSACLLDCANCDGASACVIAGDHTTPMG